MSGLEIRFLFSFEIDSIVWSNYSRVLSEIKTCPMQQSLINPELTGPQNFMFVLMGEFLHKYINGQAAK